MKPTGAAIKASFASFEILLILYDVYIIESQLPSPLIKTFLHHRMKFLRFLRARVDQSEIALEMVQDLFIKIVEKGHTVQSEKHFLAWCYQVLRHSIQDYYRHQQVKRRALQGYRNDLTQKTEPREQANLCPCMNTLLPTLKPEYAKALVQVMIQEESLDHFAKQEHVTINHATVRLHRARQSLRKKLLHHCGACAKTGCLDCTCQKNPPL